jgi:hypothetical protein
MHNDRSLFVIWMASRRLQENALPTIRGAALDFLKLERQGAPSG